LKPKSYWSGIAVKKLIKNINDLMMIQGPIYPYLMRYDNFFPLLKTNAAAIDFKFKFSKKRIDCLIKSNIHIKGKENWIFIKMHTHGAVDDKIMLGGELDKVFRYL
jgi:hypothetical protein